MATGRKSRGLSIADLAELDREFRARRSQKSEWKKRDAERCRQHSRALALENGVAPEPEQAALFDEDDGGGGANP